MKAVHKRTSTIATLVFLGLFAAGCEDKGKASEQGAIAEIGYLGPILKEDVAQVRRGLPVGASKIAPMLDPDTLVSLQSTQRAIVRMRSDVHDLEIAKSTFFSLTDATGTVLRSEADPDVLAGKSIVATFPELKKALEPSSRLVEAFGEMKELRGVRTGPDLAWVVAAPVVDKGQSKGMIVTGWSFRALAYHLETQLKMHISQEADKKQKKTPPFGYVYVVKGNHAYGTPTTPEVNAKVVEELDLPKKAANGVYHEAREITGRMFGIAGEKVPELGEDAAIAVVFSEI